MCKYTEGMEDYDWFIIIDGKQLGPFPTYKLKKLPGLTPDAFAWREGMEDWKKIRDIPELQSLFEDEWNPVEEENMPPPSEDIALAVESASPPFYFWVILILLLIAYVFFEFYS